MVVYFHRVSVTGLSANALGVPLLLLVIPLGFAAILTGWQAFAVPTALFLKCGEGVAAWHMRFEPSWRMGAVPLWAALGFSGALIALALAARWQRRRAIWGTVAVALVFFGIISVQPWRSQIRCGTFELTAIDVSQGDSLFLAFPNGETMLVDAGGFPGMERMARKPQLDMGEDVISPYLWSRSIRHLDYAVLTHGHSDHIAGLPAILDNFAPRQLWIGAEPDSAAWHSVQAHAASSRTAIVPLRRGAPEISIGGVRVRVLAPAPDYVPSDAPGNNDSLVLEMTYKKRSVLLTGDAEKPVEEDLAGNTLLSPVTLLKVGHHGSKTSSTDAFLSALSPQFAIISDGYNNQFHHPHTVVLDRLAEHHVAVFRTDRQGLVTFLTDGDGIEIRSFR
jgi:competence protein ComEC